MWLLVKSSETNPSADREGSGYVHLGAVNPRKGETRDGVYWMAEPYEVAAICLLQMILLDRKKTNFRSHYSKTQKYRLFDYQSHGDCLEQLELPIFLDS
jgi:hypothetical protein